MYVQHFGLSDEPFALTPNPDSLFLSRGHAEALAALEIGLKSRRGLIVMTGEVGTGKTTLLYSLLQHLQSEMRIAYIANTRLPFRDILRQVVSDFGIACDDLDQVALHTALNQFLLRCASDNTIAAVVIDEAQNLDDDAFENLRLLSNFETFTTKLIQIVLVGQPEIDRRLASPALRQVAERVAVRCHINPLTRREGRQYIDHRLRRVHGSADLFTRAALRLVLRRTGGIPRRMNILCDNALLFAYGRSLRQVSRACVRAANVARSAAAASPLRGAGRLERLATAVAPAPPRLRTTVAAAVGGTLVGAAFVAAATTGLPVAWLGRAAVPPAAPPAVRALAALEPDAYQPPPPHPQVATVANLAPEAEPPAPIGAPPPGAPADGAPAHQTTRAPAVEPQQIDEGTDADLASSPDPPAPPFGMVRVVPGASLESLAQHFYGDVNPQLLRGIQMANPQIVDLNRILVGDTLRFPNPESRPMGGKHE